MLIVKMPEGSMEIDSGFLVFYESENNSLDTHSQNFGITPRVMFVARSVFTVKFSCSWFQEVFTLSSRSQKAAIGCQKLHSH